MLFAYQQGQTGRGSNAAAGSGNAEAAAFLADLVAYWELNENDATPTFTDSHGSNDLTLRLGATTPNTSTQSTASGKVDRAWNSARADNGMCYVPRSNTALDMTTDDIHTIGGWFKTNYTSGTTAFIIGRVGSAFAKLHFWVFVDPADGVIKTRYSADNTTAAVTVSSGIAVDGSEWQLIVASYNRTANTLTIRLRKEVSGGMASASAALGSAITSTSNDCNFTIGEGLENDSSYDGTNNRSGVISADECFYTQGEMTDDIFDYLFNAGAGKSYADIVADAA